MNAAGFLDQSGLLFHINRTVLHPLGRNMCVREGQLDVDDCTDNPTTCFTKEEFEEGIQKLTEYLNREGIAIMEKRKGAIGYVTQKEV